MFSTTLLSSAVHIPLADASAQCCVTSPPYWGLRDYGTDPQVWGGDPACDHVWGDVGPPHHPGQVEQTKWKSAEAAGKGQTAGSGQWCDHGCGAWRGHLGLEPTPQLYVAHLVAVFREVHRVLAPDGVLWLNLGDSYARDAGKGQHKPGDSGKQAYVYDRGGGRASAQMDLRRRASESRGSSDGAVGRADRAPVRVGADGLKPKDLVGIPWRVAFALQDDGWYLRQDIIWHKPNPMPESVKDRCTKAHEYLFLLTKSERYYFDTKAIEEPAQNRAPGNKVHKYADLATNDAGNPMRTKARLGRVEPCETRNRRSVWTIPTRPYRGAHFAVFPPALVEPCILAGSKSGDVVLDPFTGSGTAVMVAKQHGRHGVGLDLNPAYHTLARARIAGETTREPRKPRTIHTAQAPAAEATPCTPATSAEDRPHGYSAAQTPAVAPSPEALDLLDSLAGL